MIFRGSVLLFALLFNARIVWQALGEQTVSLQTATIHFLITVPVVAVLFGLFRMATRRPPTGPQRPGQSGQTHRIDAG